MVEVTATEKNKEKRMKRMEESLRDLRDNNKCTSIQIIGVPEEEEKKKGKGRSGMERRGVEGGRMTRGRKEMALALWLTVVG